MATRWHINKKGEPGRCTAKIKCDFANANGEEPPHFGTQKEAREAVEKALEHLSVPASLKREEEIPKWKQDKIRRATAPLNRKKFEKLSLEQKLLEENQKKTESAFSDAVSAISQHNEIYDGSSVEGSAIYEDLVDGFEITKNHNLDAKEALKKFNDLNGRKMDAFRAENLNREEYGKLYAERGQLAWDVEAAQHEVDKAESALSENDYYSSENDNLNLDAHDSLMRDFGDASDRLDERLAEMKKFRDDNEEKMDRHVKEFGEWDWQDEFVNGKKEAPDMDLDMWT